jgi:hypothetical protein
MRHLQLFVEKFNADNMSAQYITFITDQIIVKYTIYTKCHDL